MQNDNVKLKILILGGGFGGVRCALDLEKKLKNKVLAGQVEITLIDKNSWHLFVPALYEVASAYGVKKDPFATRLKKTICIPYSNIFENKKINFVQAEIYSVDLENRKVATSGGEVMDYDYLVIALGSQPADFAIPGVKEYAFQFKYINDALMLNQKIDELTKEVAVGARSKPVKIAIVGAGFTGIELAAELACCVKKLAKACNIKGRCERIMLLEAGPKILPAVSDKERAIILERLTHLGVEVMENVAAEEVRNNYIKLKNGKEIEAELMIWTAGVRLPELLERTSFLPLTEKKKIKVNNGLEADGLAGVFAVGDNTEFIDLKTSKPVPALAYVAVDQGRIAAKNIIRLINNKKPVAYGPFYSVWIAPVGGKFALARLWGINIKGFWGWLLRELVDFKYMLSILSINKAISIMWQEITLFTKND